MPVAGLAVIVPLLGGWLARRMSCRRRRAGTRQHVAHCPYSLGKDNRHDIWGTVGPGVANEWDGMHETWVVYVAELRVVTVHLRM